MAKFKDISKLVQQGITELTDKRQLRVLGEDAKGLVQKRTRLGRGVDKNLAPSKPLKKLSNPYRAQRKRLKKRGELDRTTSPARSNLTQTGEMLREIGVKVTRGTVRLRFLTPFAKKKAEWVQDAGRKFFYISKAEARQLTNQLNKRVNRILKKLKGA